MGKAKKAAREESRSGAARRETKPLASPEWTAERLAKLSNEALVTLQKNAERRDNIELALLCSEALEKGQIVRGAIV
jgi:hypothetical protein